MLLLRMACEQGLCMDSAVNDKERMNDPSLYSPNILIAFLVFFSKKLYI